VGVCDPGRLRDAVKNATGDTRLVCVPIPYTARTPYETSPSWLPDIGSLDVTRCRDYWQRPPTCTLARACPGGESQTRIKLPPLQKRLLMPTTFSCLEHHCSCSARSLQTPPPNSHVSHEHIFRAHTTISLTNHASALMAGNYR
jgi:hypothetical protein